MTTGEFILRFVGSHPFLSFLLICAAYYAWKYPWHVLKRAIRSRDIQKHGWPTAPNMDADGDLVFPDKDEAA